MSAYKHRPTARAALDNASTRLERKRRRATTGLVEVPGPLSPTAATAIRNLTKNVLERERRRDVDAELLSVSMFAEGLAIETSSEKLAQHIADALARSHHAEIERTFDDEGRRRILTCRI